MSQEEKFMSRLMIRKMQKNQSGTIVAAKEGGGIHPGHRLFPGRVKHGLAQVEWMPGAYPRHFFCFAS